jgi:alkylated DNA repair dioxygenase AlkB
MFKNEIKIKFSDILTMFSNCHEKKYLSDKKATNLLEQMKKDIGWKQMKWGRGNLPRLIWHYEEKVCPMLDDIINYVEYQKKVNVIGVFCNFYRNGNDYTPFHKDNYDSDVISISLGGTRRFVLKNDKDKSKKVFQLDNGDLFWLTEKMNNEYTHSIPKTKAKKLKDLDRISIVLFVRKEDKKSGGYKCFRCNRNAIKCDDGAKLCDKHYFTCRLCGKNYCYNNEDRPNTLVCFGCTHDGYGRRTMYITC